MHTAVVHSLVLDLQSFVADLEAIHLLDSAFSRNNRIIRHKTKTLAFTSKLINIYFGTDHISEGIECCREIGIRQIMR